MPAQSKSQQRFMGMVRAFQQGKLDTSSVPADVLKQIKSAAESMTAKEVKKFATTKHKGLPQKVKEGQTLTFKQFLIEQYSNS